MSSQTNLAKFATCYLGQPFLQIVKLDHFCGTFCSLLGKFLTCWTNHSFISSELNWNTALAALAAGDCFFPEKYFARPTGTVLLCLSVIALAGKFFMRDQML